VERRHLASTDCAAQSNNAATLNAPGAFIAERDVGVPSIQKLNLQGTTIKHFSKKKHSIIELFSKIWLYVILLSKSHI